MSLSPAKGQAADDAKRALRKATSDFAQNFLAAARRKAQ